MNIKFMAKAASIAKVAVFKLREVRPEIMLGAGALSLLAGTIMACKKTKEAEPVVEHAKEELEELKKVSETGYAEEKPTFHEYVRVYTRHGFKLVKIYALPAALWAGGLACVIGSHGEMRSRNAKLLANSVALKKFFDEYRDAVREKIGEEAERDLYFGAEEGDVTVIETDPKTGEKKHSVKKGKIFKKPLPGSKWARNYTPRTCDEFDVRSYNITRVEKLQELLNRDLETQPFITINEVYDRFNFKPPFGKCAEGMTNGWKGGVRFDPENPIIRIEMREGWEEGWDYVLDRMVVQPCLRLDFNCYPLEGLV